MKPNPALENGLDKKTETKVNDSIVTTQIPITTTTTNNNTTVMNTTTTAAPASGFTGTQVQMQS